MAPPWPVQALTGDPRTPRGPCMQRAANELPRIPIPRTPVNKGEVGESGPSSPAPTYTLPQQARHQQGNDDERNPDCTPPRPRARRHTLTLCDRGFLPSVSIRVGVFGAIPQEPPYLGHRPEDHPLDEERWLGEVNLVFVVVHDESQPKRVLGYPRLVRLAILGYPCHGFEDCLRAQRRAELHQGVHFLLLLAAAVPHRMYGACRSHDHFAHLVNALDARDVRA